MSRSSSSSRKNGAASKAPPPAPDDAELARRLDEAAELLEAQDANPFRVRAYRNAAETLRALERPASAILAEEGVEGLEALPGIGESLARAIETLVRGGRWPLLERLRGEAAPEDALTSVPGIGRELARRIHDELGIESLHELELAAHDGRLERVPGMGRRRVRGVRESLAGRFHRGAGSAARRPKPLDEPPVAELLDIDREYREKAARDALMRIAPKRFNPERKAWLPILHAHRGPRHYTALFSNTARAHELGATRDWVVIYRDEREGDGLWTVITAHLGSLAGKRIVRGREAECADYYGDRSTTQGPAPSDPR